MNENEAMFEALEQLSKLDTIMSMDLSTVGAARPSWEREKNYAKAKMSDAKVEYLRTLLASGYGFRLEEDKDGAFESVLAASPALCLTVNAGRVYDTLCEALRLPLEGSTFFGVGNFVLACDILDSLANEIGLDFKRGQVAVTGTINTVADLREIIHKIVSRNPALVTGLVCKDLVNAALVRRWAKTPVPVYLSNVDPRDFERLKLQFNLGCVSVKVGAQRATKDSVAKFIAATTKSVLAHQTADTDDSTESV